MGGLGSDLCFWAPGNEGDHSRISFCPSFIIIFIFVVFVIWFLITMNSLGSIECGTLMVPTPRAAVGWEARGRPQELHLPSCPPALPAPGCRLPQPGQHSNSICGLPISEGAWNFLCFQTGSPPASPGAGPGPVASSEPGLPNLQHALRGTPHPPEPSESRSHAFGSFSYSSSQLPDSAWF